MPIAPAPMAPPMPMAAPMDAPMEPLADPEADAVAEAASMGARETIGATAPEADEPIPQDRLNALVKAMEKTFEELSDGQFDLPPIASFSGPVDIVPPEVYAPLMALGTFANDLDEGAPYRMDVPELSKTPEGVDHMMTLIANMGRDKKLMRAIRRAGAAEPEAEAEVVVEETPGGKDSLAGLL